MTTLTCRSCNNTHGSKIDAHLIQMMRSRDSIEGLSDRPFRGRIEVAGMSVPTDINWKASVGKTTTFALRPFDPVVHEAIRSEMTGGKVRTLNVTLRFDFIPGRSNLALLRIAYLAMFRELGYRYILSRSVSVIRNVINSFETCPSEIGQFVGEMGGEPQRFGKGIHFLKIRDGIAIMVVVPLITETTRYYAAFMPSPELPPESVITTLCDAARSLDRRLAVQPQIKS